MPTKKERVRFGYEELWQPASVDAAPTFPDACPCCEAKVDPDAVSDETYRPGPVYLCGGQYVFKSQIQNHTDKWWGRCPPKMEASRLADGHECGGCHELRLEGTNLPDSFDWKCMACGHNNPGIKK